MVQRIPLGGRNGAGLYALVDDADYERVSAHKWRAYIPRSRHTIYAHGRVNGRDMRMHCFILDAVGIDHWDGNGLNNQRSNLRVATQAQNLANRAKQPGGTSRFKGVSWAKHRSVWVAYISDAGRNRRIGQFADEIDAAKAYDAAARELFGEFARLNFPQ